MATTQKPVWLFREGKKELRDLLGGKGANLAEMTNIGLPVPPGFTVTTEVCTEYYANNKQIPSNLMDEVKRAVADVEQSMGKKFGDNKNPLLFSVRSGAKFSLPGMMDTVLNLGLNESAIEGLIAVSGDARFAYDSYRRFIMMFSDITLKADYPGLSKEGFEHMLTDHKAKLGKSEDTELTGDDWKALCETYKVFFKEQTGRDFPTDPYEQLETSITAVFRSWNNERAIIYRNKEKIDHKIGTAVNVQAMVFGNMGDDSGSGVMFTRNAATGENVIYGEYLQNAQGEDVVAGVRTPKEIAELERDNKAIYDELIANSKRLEDHYKDMQDIEFTIEKNNLFILQCRSGKRTGTAAIRIAVEMVGEGFISKEKAVSMVAPSGLEQALHPRLKNTAAARKIAQGLNAGPGGAVGMAVFSSDRAAELGKNGGEGKAVILCSAETTPDDLKGMLAAQGVLTSRGGRTSHAALVARQFGIPTICGCSDVKMDGHHATSFVTPDGTVIKEGDWITIDGTEGIVYEGALEVEAAGQSGDFATLMGWADEFRTMGVRANADTPEQAAEALGLGAEGIGLCRTEHMFLEESRLPIVRRMVLAADDAERQQALDELLPIQREDFVGIFRAMNGKPVTVRLIDPPLHEFLPNQIELEKEMAVLESKGLSDPEKSKLLSKVRELHEMNPMLGLRGVRLSIVFPGIVEMQTAAIVGAAAQVKKEGIDVNPEIMIPLIGHVNELKAVRGDLERVAKETAEKEGQEVAYKFGTMIEIPRACLTAGEIAQEAEFFSFGTNDLTQMTYGMSRDDAGPFLMPYIAKEIYKEDPTVSIDVSGVGRLMQICVDDARKVNPGIKLGICGEQGGDPDSVKFCAKLGLTYVSCSPKRVPVARLAAAQAAIDAK
ncbi:pyruvate phosphate dikinase [Abditibacterium utsteinense]|uniref:Pyruvate, phosphate dikinase n=1 Tax=Abditibacterium utsteinense TaxID=1960156 RepID=A0A2S8SRK5_9BACT|nr:pyruvate, phosphate dikinase [Abditibacterium utsteinense]PQV63441.1 pyruvate phosphate dikinase [Abditibacterium utsteinense]